MPLLEGIGFVWDLAEKECNDNYAKLKRFYGANGHSNVSALDEKNAILGFWVSTQRIDFKKQLLSEDRIALLNNIEFVWDMNESAQQEKYQRLIKYIDVHGNARVPARHPQDSGLGKQVSHQRDSFDSNKLSKERKKLLDKVNFIWDINEYDWQNTYKQLLQYRELHRRVNAPAKYPENKSLGKLISHQRSYRKRNELSQESIDFLNNIGFEWSLK